jgi:hypothetical protein
MELRHLRYFVAVAEAGSISSLPRSLWTDPRPRSSVGRLSRGERLSSLEAVSFENN